MDRVFSLKHTISRYTDRLDTAAAEAGFFLDDDSMFMDSLR